MAARDRSGFTLIEALISLSILSIVLVTILSIYQFHLVTWKRNEELMEVLDNLRISLDRIGREVRQAKALHPDSDDNKIKFYATGSETIEYFLEGTDIYRKKGNGVKQPVASYITALEFRYGPEGLVAIKITGGTNRTGEISYTTSIRIRTLVN